jgi:hypothetical protein
VNLFPELRFFLSLFTLVCWSAATPATVWADAKLEGTNPAQWRLIWHDDPATSAVLSWNTAKAGQMHRVHVRAEGAEKSTVVEAARNGRYAAKSPELYFHHARLTDLIPGTKYHVEIESDGRRSRSMYFITAPVEDVPISVVFGADSRSGLKERRQVNAMLAQLVTESYQPGKTPILAFAHGGDFIVSGTQLDQWSQWMSDHELTVGADGRLLPIIPTRGNHDTGKIFNQVFDFPPKDTNYYPVDLGPQVRLVTLNTETSVAGKQVAWLNKELAASRPKYRWLFAQYHRPAFPAVKNPWINLTHWVPLFERYNVDLVCEGDGHNIKRTPPIRDHRIDPTGVVYVGEGGLGVGQRTPKAGRWYLTGPQAKVGMGHHVQLLTFKRDQLTCRVMMLGGEVFDEYTLQARPPKTAAKPSETR